MQNYSESYRSSTSLTETIESEIGALLLLEREVRELRDPTLEEIVEAVKSCQAWLLQGKPVPHDALRELIAFVRRNAQPEGVGVS